MSITLTGLGKASNKPRGYFNSEIEVDNSKFKVDIFVIKPVQLILI